MAKIERFEELDCWRQSRKVANLVYDICEKESLAKDFSTKDQLKRAGLSIMNNIAEGFGRYSTKEFIRYLEISQASALEVRSMLYILLDRKHLNQTEFDALLAEVTDVTNQIIGFIRYLKNRKIKNLLNAN